VKKLKFKIGIANLSRGYGTGPKNLDIRKEVKSCLGVGLGPRGKVGNKSFWY
jgi:hypothetical protein